MNILIFTFSVSKGFIRSSNWVLYISHFHWMTAVYVQFGDFNGSFNGVSGFPSVEGVSSSIVDAIFDGAFGVSKDTVDGRRGIFDKANGSGFAVGAKLSTCSYTQ